MSTISIVGLAGVSKKKTLVLGWIAAFQASLSRLSMVVVVMPQRGSRLSVSQRHEPNAARAATTWSPWLNWQSNAVVIAAIPVACIRQASAPSISAIRSSTIATVGFCRRL